MGVLHDNEAKPCSSASRLDNKLSCLILRAVKRSKSKRKGIHRARKEDNTREGIHNNILEREDQIVVR